jgi:antibiotic biosynthesis monooxygenase (ABM) superfamily enzyme
MKTDHSVLLKMPERSVISVAGDDPSPHTITATQNPFAVTSPKIDQRSSVASREHRTAARTNRRLALSFGSGPLLAAFFVFAGLTIARAEPQVQMDPKLVGTGFVGPAEQGWSVALSADGNTAIIGGIVDNKLTGAAWVFTRDGAMWTQQGSKLVGTGAVGQAGQGFSVALSADGNTAIVGGPYDNSHVGAVWVFNRNGGIWAQQGSKLVGLGAVGSAAQGVSVALSADGNTAIVGGTQDNLNSGAAWGFTRSGSVWTQQGSKLVGTGAVGSATQGTAVALSADGNTAIVGGASDDSHTGAAWAFRRAGLEWRQDGGKLVGTGAAGRAGQGFSVALSADGNTVIVGGLGDNSSTGAAWVFTRSTGAWTQQGSKLVGSDGVGMVKQGHSVALSADGNTAVVGGPYDNSYAGAAWVYRRDGIVWRQEGSKLVGTAVGRGEHGYSVALSADGNTALAGGIADNKIIGAAWIHSRNGGVWAPIKAPDLRF